MRILLLIHGFNALSQRVLVELEELGHEVTIEFDINDANTLSAINSFGPDLVLAPYLKRAIPETIWKNHLCLIVHPGPIGDRGPSAIDWAILNDEKSWGVTVLQPTAQMDAGPVWHSENFEMVERTKSSTYRIDVTEAAVAAIKKCLEELQQNGIHRKPEKDLITDTPFMPTVKQSDRAIVWDKDTTKQILRKIRSADGVPGVKAEVCGKELFIYDALEAVQLLGTPGELIAVSGPAICMATTDGALWIGHVRDLNSGQPFKLPAVQVLSQHLGGLKKIGVDSPHGYREILYERAGDVGHLYFEFYNGAMSSEQCERLLTAYKEATRINTKVIVLHGGVNFWSNGMHLNVIEASDSPADESWRNINAIDDLAEAIIRTKNQITVAAVGGNAGAGGVFLARACDRVWLRKGVILNPHYKDMGNLYGSEFWSYLLPRYCGDDVAKEISQRRYPMGSKEAVRLGLADRCFGESLDDFGIILREETERLAKAVTFNQQLIEKSKQRELDELNKPLAQYREEELEKMRQNFFGFDPSYHIARYNFVYKIPKSRTPITLARHRDQRLNNRERKVS